VAWSEVTDISRRGKEMQSEMLISISTSLSGYSIHHPFWPFSLRSSWGAVLLP
jgi:hypothetical protein